MLILEFREVKSLPQGSNQQMTVQDSTSSVLHLTSIALKKTMSQSESPRIGLGKNVSLWWASPPLLSPTSRSRKVDHRNQNYSCKPLKEHLRGQTPPLRISNFQVLPKEHFHNHLDPVN